MAEQTDSQPVAVDVNTDDLDAFSDLFAGKTEAPAKEAKAEPVVEAPVAADSDATDDVAEPEAEAPEPEAPEAEEDAPVEEAAPEDEEEDEFKPKSKNRTTAQERISELTAARKAAEREAQNERNARQALEARLAALEAGQKTEPKTPERRAPVDPDMPDPMATDAAGNLVYPLGEFDPQYVADTTRHIIRRESEAARVAEQAAAQERQAQEAETKLQTQWVGKLEEAEKDFEDLRPTIASLESQLREVEPEYGTFLAQTIMQMEVGPQVLYYLANHPDEANEIVAAGPVGATLKLGKLEAKVEAALEKRRVKPQSPAAPVRQSQAPEPPATVRGVGSRNGVSADTDDLDAFSDVFFNKKRK